jgi:hypothetical protein
METPVLIFDPKGKQTFMANPFQLNPDETILYSSNPSMKWYALAWRIGLELLEVAIFILFSFTALAGLAITILAKILPPSLAGGLSWLIFQGLVPLLLVGWFTEDTARIFTSKFILTDQRIWTKGTPYAWSKEREIPLSDIRFMSARRDALFIHLKSTRKTLVHAMSDSKNITKIFTQFSGKADSE